MTTQTGKKVSKVYMKLTFTYDQQRGKKSCSLFFSKWINGFFFQIYFKEHAYLCKLKG